MVQSTMLNVNITLSIFLHITGVAGRLMMFEATGPYADTNYDSTMERLIGHAIWKAPMAGTYNFVAVICTGDIISKLIIALN